MNKVFEKIIEKQKELFQDLNVIEVLSHVDFDSTIQNSLENFLKAITNEAIEIVKQEAEKYEECYKDCGDCEAYNKEKHHCPKFCKVIKETVKEIEENHNGWIPCSERLPEEAFGCLVTVMDCNPSTQTLSRRPCRDSRRRL